MNSLKEKISVALLCHSSLDNMLNCSTRRERIKHGRVKTTDIQIGDILLDSKHFKTSLSYVGSLVRVVQITRSNSAAPVLLLGKRNEVHIRGDPLSPEGRHHAWIGWAAHDELEQLSLTLLFGQRALNYPHSSGKF